MMIQPKICQQCIAGNHEDCDGKKLGFKIFGGICECYICKKQ